MNIINKSLYITILFAIILISVNSQQYNYQQYYQKIVNAESEQPINNASGPNNKVSTPTSKTLPSKTAAPSNRAAASSNRAIAPTERASNNQSQSTSKQIAFSQSQNIPKKEESTDNRQNTNKNSEEYEKAKAKAIDKLPIEKEDLKLIKWNEFDHHGFNITINTPNVIDDNTIINIKWRTIDNLKPSSSIKIELHTNLTRRDSYMVYPVTETISIDDNIPKEVTEISWNPYVKFKKNERYYIRVWAYTNNNTATMSGLCLWSINDILPDKNVETQTTKGTNYFKTVAFPAIGALLCFTVVGHFVYESKKANKYHSLNDNNSDADSQDGLNNKGEKIYYDAIKIEENERNNFHTLPQPWELEAKRKLTLTRQNNQSSLSDGSSNYQRLIDSSDNYEDISIVLNEARNNNDPISLTIEKPSIPKLPKIPKYQVNNPVQSRSHHHKHHHHHHHSSSGGSYDSHGNRKSLVDSIIISKNRN
ncbi:hypothetical protein PIROE2DRAFT_21049 [Piromyces sp. E2]|nr:hypothetical protein PIROE2DRAFT_21049 [Piromyces sp. E2]|eukprot:OUM60772.1 hypothetical protein PIROE2DRAFT_21049 [Piromyces sp. E2]